MSNTKEVAGAMLDKPILSRKRETSDSDIRLTQGEPVNAAQIETGPKGVPAIVAESSKVKV